MNETDIRCGKTQLKNVIANMERRGMLEAGPCERLKFVLQYVEELEAERNDLRAQVKNLTKELGLASNYINGRS